MNLEVKKIDTANARLSAKPSIEKGIITLKNRKKLII